MTVLRKTMLIIVALLNFISPLALAAKSTGFGSIADGISQPVAVMTDIVHIVCIVAGAGLILGSFIRFLRYRKNPVEVTLFSCIMLLFAGIALIVLAFIPKPQ